MPDGDNIHSVDRICEGFERSVYSIFEDNCEKDITLWQPEATVDDIGSLPKPKNIETKAKSFLDLAGGSDLAVAPEWSYNVEWLDKHDELFADESPLFVLGCRPVRIRTMEDIVANLRGEFRVIGEDVPDDHNKEFVTPTIVPLRSEALPGVDKPTVVIQYKTHPMSEGANPNEADNLALGNRIHHFGPMSGVGVVVWTCSDILNDNSLFHQVKTYAQRGNIVVHPQCNPKPFHSEWTDFRSRIFNNKNDVTYICANWGNVPTLDRDDYKWGYSGVYTKARKWSSFENYDLTYENKGLLGVKPSNKFEYVWTLVEDGVSKVRVRREGNSSAPAQSLRPEPQILSTQVWSGSEYDDQPDGFDECVCENCDQCDCKSCSNCNLPKRKNKLPEAPREAELIAAVTLWRFEIDELDGLDNKEDVPLAALKNLRANGQEELGHSFASYDHCKGNRVDVNTKRVFKTFEAASDEYSRSIDPKDQCQPLDIPINATDGDPEGIDISLSLLNTPTPGSQRRRLTEIAKLRKFQSFKPLVLMVSPSNSELNRIEGLEDVTNGEIQPEDITASGSSIEFVGVNK